MLKKKMGRSTKDCIVMESGHQGSSEAPPGGGGLAEQLKSLFSRIRIKMAPSTSITFSLGRTPRGGGSSLKPSQSVSKSHSPTPLGGGGIRPH